MTAHKQSESLVSYNPTFLLPRYSSDLGSITESGVKYNYVLEYFLKWKVEKKFQNNTIKSYTFNIGNMEACLTLKAPDHDKETCHMYFQILSRYNSFPRGKFTLNYEDDTKTAQTLEIKIGAETFTQGRGWGFPLNVKSGDRVTATFDCAIWYYVADDLKPSDSTVVQSQKMSANYLQLLKNGDFSDVTLKVGDEVLKAHKCILSSRSRVFAAMLKTDMAESNSGEIVIEDIEIVVMKILLRFIYSGSLEVFSELNKDLMLDLLGAADKYDISDLTPFCSAALIKLMNIENAVELLNAAILYNVDALKTHAQLLITKNIRVVSKTECWKELKKASPQEALEIMENALSMHLPGELAPPKVDPFEVIADRSWTGRVEEKVDRVMNQSYPRYNIHGVSLDEDDRWPQDDA